jgi:hypothetical protein
MEREYTSFRRLIVAHDGAVEEMGWLVDLSGLKFAETEDRARWIQILPMGTWQHPIHGTIELNAEKANRFVNNFYNKVRGTDLDADYDHKAKRDDAAGWFRAVEARADGLWAKIEWTREAFAKLQEGGYKYFSAEFAKQWKNPKTGVVHEDVLFGGALTNRPFIKDITPINLSETVGGSLMDPKQIRELLGLPEDATDEQVKAKLAEVVAAGTQQPDPSASGGEPPKNEPVPPKVEEPVKEPATLSEPDPELVKLAETNPAVKAMLDAQAETARKLAEQQASIVRLEAKGRQDALGIQLNDLLSPTDDGRKRVIAPHLRVKLAEELSTLPVALSDKVVALLRDVLKGDGIVELGEIGTTGGSAHSDGVTAIKRMTDQTDKLMLADKDLSYGDALEQVALSDPDLYEAYRRESQVLILED